MHVLLGYLLWMEAAFLRIEMETMSEFESQGEVQHNFIDWKLHVGSTQQRCCD